MSTPAAGPGLKLDKVVLLGRTLEEYQHFFGLTPHELQSRAVLDVAAGVSSFCAEANVHGWKVTAFDPIYAWAPDIIAAQCAQDLPAVVRAIGDAGTYRWDFYGSPERMGKFRARAQQRFLEDYARHRMSGSRYVAGQLPHLPFANRQFDLVLASYLLLVYEAQFSYEFHRDSFLEIMRVTRGEARVYPTVTFEAKPSAYLQRLRTDPALAHLEFREVRTEFEFLLGSNAYLSIRHKADPSPRSG